jgi:hypothetical protein
MININSINANDFDIEKMQKSVNKTKINHYNVYFTKHAVKRMNDRNVAIQEINYVFHNRFHDLQYAKYLSQKFYALKSGIGTILFTFENNKINIVTILDYDMEVNNAIVL